MTLQRISGALRVFRLAYVLSAVAITILILYPWLEASARLRFRGGQRLISRTFHRTMAALLGLRISIKGIPSSTRPLILVANHISWLDIVAICSVFPAILVYAARSCKLANLRPARETQPIDFRESGSEAGGS